MGSVPVQKATYASLSVSNKGKQKATGLKESKRDGTYKRHLYSYAKFDVGHR